MPLLDTGDPACARAAHHMTILEERSPFIVPMLACWMLIGYSASVVGRWLAEVCSQWRHYVLLSLQRCCCLGSAFCGLLHLLCFEANKYDDYDDFQQHLYFVLRMCRNGYLWTFGVNLDTAVWFADPDLLLECKILAIWRRFLTPIRCWVMSANASHWLPLKRGTRPLRMCRFTWPVRWVGGQKQLHFLESPTPICLFTIQLLLGYDDD